eukprot:TRINITY_DN796_c0_g1_i1.p1 TRINITY_DN796_c0_g1~~TRINITY_DN796_c0_g1_i1.p1  ORF type:complete len:401 (+),score=127.57 TRINITY_DN796_c0_g1_i1:66-1205(+)
MPVPRRAEAAPAPPSSPRREAEAAAVPPWAAMPVPRRAEVAPAPPSSPRREAEAAAVPPSTALPQRFALAEMPRQLLPLATRRATAGMLAEVDPGCVLEALALCGLRGRLPAEVPPAAAVDRWLASGGSRLVDVTAGSLPVVLCAPHDGTRKPRGVVPRDPARHATIRDTNARLVANACAAALRRRTGMLPHVVSARADRKYCDVGRPPSQACDLEVREARMYYYAYHMQVSARCDEARRNCGGRYRLPRPLFLDLHGHGQRSGAKSVYRGSMNGQSFAADPDVPGGHPVLSALSQHCPVLPRVHGDAEVPGYTGGWGVQAYGLAFDRRGADAIQLELGYSLRSSRKQCAVFGEWLADAVLRYLSAYEEEGGEGGSAKE